VIKLAIDDFDILNEKARVLRVLAHPVRLCIVRGLWEKGSCNVSHMQSCLETPQSTLSQHLQRLRAAGIVSAVRNGTEMKYTLNMELIGAWLPVLFSEK
jgi:ArsR family transcriptional regulator